MENTFKISHGNPYPLGATVTGPERVNFAVVMNTDEDCGVILTDKKTGKSHKAYFCCSNKVGNIRCMQIEPIDINRYEYNFFNGDDVICDPYSRRIIGNDIWGKTPKNLRSSIVNSDYNWQSDRHPLLKYSDSVFYQLHVRGFTKHKSSKVMFPGTFEGVVEKIGYLKELGVTSVEMLPVYNFVELEEKTQKDETELQFNPFENNEPKLNYWGYKESFYFAPKSSFARKGVDPCVSFKNMVKAFHSNGMEVILQFFFPDHIKQGYIFEVLKYWMQEYRVDGFRLMGNKLPLAMLCTDPMLANTKLITYDFPLNDVYEHNVTPLFKNLAVSTDSYMYDMRRFIKSDEGLIGNVMNYIKEQPRKTAQVHYITNANGFTLMDLVSYDKKHNEDNGENNRDGAAYNGSWNCGFEGPTRKKSVYSLRMKQLKNAIVLNMISNGAPLILAGDEFGNSQKGNNNPYCHDNLITWLNWNDLEKNKDIFDFTKEMISFRKANGILHLDEAFMMNDYLNLGNPDLSFHSEEAWKVDTDPLRRQIGLMYNGGYSKSGNPEAPEYIYIAINMHWTCHDYAIPKLTNKKKWKVLTNTDISNYDVLKNIDTNYITVKERSIVILVSE